jgi:hypothetical protein
MPFTNREVAVIVANELNRHDRGLWFYEVERHIDDKRWIIARKRSSQKSVPNRPPSVAARNHKWPDAQSWAGFRRTLAETGAYSGRS